MTVSTPDIQALIEEANGNIERAASAAPDLTAERIRKGDVEDQRLSLIVRMSAALSALSGETEGEWEYGSKGYCFDWDDRRCRFISGSLAQLLEHEEEQHLSDHSSCAVRRRKAGPWIEVV